MNHVHDMTVATVVPSIVDDTLVIAAAGEVLDTAPDDAREGDTIEICAECGATA